MSQQFVFEIVQTVKTSVRNDVYIKAESYEEARKIALQAYKDGGGAYGNALDGFEASELCEVGREEFFYGESEYGEDSSLVGYIPSNTTGSERLEIDRIADFYDGLYETHTTQTEGEQA